MIWDLGTPLVLLVVGPGAASQSQPPTSLIQELSGSGAKITVLGTEGDSNLVQSLGPTHGKGSCSLLSWSDYFPLFLVPAGCWALAWGHSRLTDASDVASALQEPILAFGGEPGSVPPWPFLF